MQLLRVRVPNFRALKDVDLTFEKDFVPQIFPLGSLNGGGKSTLLQLIFILLHRPDNSKWNYTQSILNHITTNENGYAELATFDIWDGEKTVEIIYFCKTIQAICDELEISSLNRQRLTKYLEENKLWSVVVVGGGVDESVLSSDMNKLLLFRHSPLFGNDQEQYFKFSEESNIRVFLAAPSSQIYFFLPTEQRKSLFKIDGNYNSALDQAKKSLPGFFTYDTFSVATLSSFFRTAWDKDTEQVVRTGKYGDNYPQMLREINQIIAGKTIIPRLINTTQGSRPLEKDLIDSIIFKANDGTEIYPEDLSHGELKKLSIYAWLKANQIKDSIVLMDEIENGFHPDWQFQIVKELEAWEPSNQYILATHSYELCTALTPSHVKSVAAIKL